MDIFYLVFYLDLVVLWVNWIWCDQIVVSGKVVFFRDFYVEYLDFKIDVVYEQDLLMVYDRIVLQFLFYWYLVMLLFKKWLDDVLIYGFVYGRFGIKLYGKDLQVIILVGGQLKYYMGFDIFVMVLDLLCLFQLMVNLCGMNYQILVWMYWVDFEFEGVICVYGEEWVVMIDDLFCFDFYVYLNSELDLSFEKVN